MKKPITLLDFVSEAVAAEKEDHYAGLNHMHIVKQYDAADADTKKYGHEWYHTAGLIAKKIGAGHQNGTHKAAGVISAYSPRTNWGRNIMHATKAMENNRGHGGPGEGCPAPQGRAAQRILNGEHHQAVLGGEKTKAFANLIEHGGQHHEHPAEPSDQVVIDRHALSIALNKRLNKHDIEGPLGDVWKSSKKGKEAYHRVADTYRKAAEHISARDGKKVAPHQVQAVTWEHFRKTAGITDTEAGSGYKSSKDTHHKNYKAPIEEGYEQFEYLDRPFSD